MQVNIDFARSVVFHLLWNPNLTQEHSISVPKDYYKPIIQPDELDEDNLLQSTDTKENTSVSSQSNLQSGEPGKISQKNTQDILIKQHFNKMINVYLFHNFTLLSILYFGVACKSVVKLLNWH